MKNERIFYINCSKCNKIFFDKLEVNETKRFLNFKLFHIVHDKNFCLNFQNFTHIVVLPDTSLIVQQSVDKNNEDFYIFNILNDKYDVFKSNFLKMIVKTIYNRNFNNCLPKRKKLCNYTDMFIDS